MREGATVDSARYARTRLPAGVALLCLLLVTACSSSSSKPSTSSAPATGSSGSSAAQAAIKNAYVKFFSGKTPATQKEDLLQHGTQFTKVIAAQANSALSKSTTATVSKVTVTGADKAQVTYTVSLGGTPALSNQTGYAVRESGSWKVAAVTFCALLSLEGTHPPACGGASATASPS